MTVTQVDPNTIEAIRREANQSLMVAFINDDLTSRYRLDVGTSVVFYDHELTFLYAVEELPADSMFEQLAAATSVRHWSYGC